MTAFELAFKECFLWHNLAVYCPNGVSLYAFYFSTGQITCCLNGPLTAPILSLVSFKLVHKAYAACSTSLQSFRVNSNRCTLKFSLSEPFFMAYMYFQILFQYFEYLFTLST